MFNLAPWATKKMPIRREEEHPMFSLQREMNRMFEDFMRTPMWEGFGESPPMAGEHFMGDVSPRLDVSETDRELLVKVELPGMNEKDVEISISKDMLTISGEKKQEKEENEKGWYRMERQYGSFSRSIPLPVNIESEKAEALFKHGLLTIKLPKSPVQEKAAKRVEITPG